METGLDGCDGSCSWLGLRSQRTLSREECDQMVAETNFRYKLVIAQEKARNYFSEAMQAYDSKYRIVVG